MTRTRSFILFFFVCVSCFLQHSRPFTVIMSDSGAPSTLLDGPQTGFSLNSDGAKTDPAEQAVVYDVMRATGNDWATDIPDVCRGRWHGIECLPDKDNVFHIVSLSFGALSDDTAFPTCDPNRSHISPSVTKLPHLRTLFFYRCLTDNPQPIPSFLGLLGPNLQSLVLRENGHIGPIPAELGNLTRLRVLDLHKNSLTGSIPRSLNRVTGLQSLDLSSNRLTGQVPDFASPVLSIVDLSQNLLVGPIPSTISTSRALIKLDLSRNRLSGPVPESMGALRELTLVDVSYNRLSGPLPGSLGTLDSLQALILKGNPLDSIEGFEGMTGLRILVLSDMNLQGEIPWSLAKLKNLRVLHLDGNRFNGSIPVSFREMRNLSELRLNDNSLTGLVPFEREMVWRMRKKLRLYGNKGLCFSPNSGLEDYVDSSFNSGIGLCDSVKPGPAGTTVQHLMSNEGVTRVLGSKKATSSAMAVGRSSFLCFWLLQIIYMALSL